MLILWANLYDIVIASIIQKISEEPEDTYVSIATGYKLTVWRGWGCLIYKDLSDMKCSPKPIIWTHSEFSHRDSYFLYVKGLIPHLYTA